MPSPRLLLPAAAALGLAACGAAGSSSSGPAATTAAAPTATPSAAGPAVSAVIGQDDCTGGGLTGTPLKSVGSDLTMVVSAGWQQSYDMGTKSNLWKATDTDDGQTSYLAVSEASTTHGLDPASEAAGTARDIGSTAPVASCTIAGEKAYFTSYKAGGGSFYYLYVQHNGRPPLQIFFSDSGQIPDNTVVPQVKRMLGSWTWAS